MGLVTTKLKPKVRRLLQLLNPQLSVIAPFTPTKFAVVKEEIKRLLVEHGISYVWQLQRLEEAVVPASAPINLPPLIAVLQDMVRKLEPRQDFVVVDRFLLPENPPSGYIDNLLSILGSVIDRVERLTFVTSKTFDATLLHDISAQVTSRSGRCRVLHRTADTFHDRFWIADRSRGLFVGASLNGIGRRYTLADYMRSEDVKQVVTALESEKIV